MTLTDRGPVRRRNDADHAEPTLSERAYRLLRDDIISGAFEQGQPLRLEQLKARYGLSFSPLREALNRLQAERLVASAALRGFRLARLSRDEMWDATETRILVEGEALRRAMQRGDDRWEAEIVAAQHALTLATRRAGGRGARIGSAEEIEIEARHTAFHRALLSACGSPRLIDLAAQLHMQTERYRRPLLRDTADVTQRDLDGEHRAIMQAALDRDAKAVALLGAHYRRTASLIDERLPASAEVSGSR